MSFSFLPSLNPLIHPSSLSHLIPLGQAEDQALRKLRFLFQFCSSFGEAPPPSQLFPAAQGDVLQRPCGLGGGCPLFLESVSNMSAASDNLKPFPCTCCKAHVHQSPLPCLRDASCPKSICNERSQWVPDTVHITSSSCFPRSLEEGQLTTLSLHLCGLVARNMKDDLIGMLNWLKGFVGSQTESKVNEIDQEGLLVHERSN